MGIFVEEFLCLDCKKKSLETELNVVEKDENPLKCPKCKSDNLICMDLIVTCKKCGKEFEEEREEWICPGCGSNEYGEE